jgi:cytoskeletal protein CcmA (bactofilin family)
MFSKASPKADKVESIIGGQSEVTGDLNVKGTLQVDGLVKGHVKADWVVLTESSRIKGDITAHKIIVSGRVEGNLKAEEAIEIMPKGKVIGDVFTNKISVAEGGGLNGKVVMSERDSKIVKAEGKVPGP